MTLEEREILKSKVKAFYDRKMRVHIRTTEGQYFWGKILRLWEDSFDIQDERRGEYPVLFAEIERIEKFKERKVMENDA